MANTMEISCQDYHPNVLVLNTKIPLKQIYRHFACFATCIYCDVLKVASVASFALFINIHQRYNISNCRKKLCPDPIARFAFKTTFH